MYNVKFKKEFSKFWEVTSFPNQFVIIHGHILGVSTAFQNENIIEILPFLGNEMLQNVFGMVRKLAGLPFGYLPLLFAMSIPLGMVRRDKEVAVYSGAVGYIAMLIGMTYVLQIQGFTSETTAMSYLMEV